MKDLFVWGARKKGKRWERREDGKGEEQALHCCFEIGNERDRGNLPCDTVKPRHAAIWIQHIMHAYKYTYTYIILCSTYLGNGKLLCPG